MNTNEYDVKVLKVVDGDTIDVDIDLGFGITLTDERVRIMGIDTPESRTSDRVEDLFGEAAKLRLKQLMKNGGKLITTEDRKGEDMKGKFGRVLGDFKVEYNGEMKKVTEIMAEEGHRVRLLKEGLVTQVKYDKAVIQMEKKAAKEAKKAAK